MLTLPSHVLLTPVPNEAESIELTIKSDFSYLLRQLAEDHTLGLVETPFKEGTNPTYDCRFVSIEHVSGACQLFRREYFEQIGGYVPVKGGCIDHIAVISARMKGWKTRIFTDKVSMHHRHMGTAQDSLVMARFRNGRKTTRLGTILSGNCVGRTIR